MDVDLDHHPVRARRGGGQRHWNNQLANAGGVINVYSEVAGWSRDRALRKADEIFDTTLGVFEIAKEMGIPTYVAADRLAVRRIAAVAEMVRTRPQWPRKS